MYCEITGGALTDPHPTHIVRARSTQAVGEAAGWVHYVDYLFISLKKYDNSAAC